MGYNVFMYENKENDSVWWYATFTKSGAYSLAKVMQDKFGCKILTEPKENKDTMWQFSFTNPFKKKVK